MSLSFYIHKTHTLEDVLANVKSPFYTCILVPANHTTLPEPVSMVGFGATGTDDVCPQNFLCVPRPFRATADFIRFSVAGGVSGRVYENLVPLKCVDLDITNSSLRKLIATFSSLYRAQATKDNCSLTNPSHVSLNISIPMPTPSLPPCP